MKGVETLTKLQIDKLSKRPKMMFPFSLEVERYGLK